MFNNKLLKILFLFIILFLIFQESLLADEVYLKNGDKISGKLVEESNDIITIESEAMGTISVDRDFIRDIVLSAQEKTAEEEAKKKIELTRDISLGYSRTSGNSQNSQLSINVNLNKKTEDNEASAKADIYYSSSNKKMNAQKWYGMARYALSFWEKKWYNFYKFEVDHDRFANIDYRIVPSTGAGYWFSDTDDWKSMLELGLGLEHTNYRDSTKDEDEIILIPRAFFEKSIFSSSKISEDLTVYSSLEDGSYRLHSETVLKNPINDNFSLHLSLINDYDSDPPAETKKNDFRFISSIVHSF